MHKAGLASENGVLSAIKNVTKLLRNSDRFNLQWLISVIFQCIQGSIALIFITPVSAQRSSHVRRRHHLRHVGQPL